MITAVTVHTLRCDDCGWELLPYGGARDFWVSADTALEAAAAGHWDVAGDGRVHRCPRCRWRRDGHQPLFRGDGWVCERCTNRLDKVTS